MKTSASIAELVKTNSLSVANQFLAEGWELVDTYTRLFHSDDDERRKEGDEYMSFVLGWPRSLGQVKKPSIPGDDLDGIDV